MFCLHSKAPQIVKNHINNIQNALKCLKEKNVFKRKKKTNIQFIYCIHLLHCLWQLLKGFRKE